MLFDVNMCLPSAAAYVELERRNERTSNFSHDFPAQRSTLVLTPSLPFTTAQLHSRTATRVIVGVLSISRIHRASTIPYSHLVRPTSPLRVNQADGHCPQYRTCLRISNVIYFNRFHTINQSYERVVYINTQGQRRAIVHANAASFGNKHRVVDDNGMSFKCELPWHGHLLKVCQRRL